ncbi:hypothetical protein NVV94_24955 [Pseudomonas sp. LS1212]|uniref:hypothetical protein n=1 Tax=Pseudomonas sp. LS1212 TaxID=2972478 RepID=UPI00215C1611|nr:hypothetical protein [Pseudomonas sp. LS1212]UVJ43737.1 hypothetical protein NVV94_24955 [Pseudomonas sp. LS1212]
MFKALPLLIVGLIAGCASSPEPASEKAPGQPQGGCYQSEWQAETVPVINKRSGSEGLEKYEPEQQQQAHGCP